MIDNKNLFAKVDLNDRIFDNLDRLHQRGINPELSITDTCYLFRRFDGIAPKLQGKLDKLFRAKLIHLPFYGIQLGCRDMYIRRLSKGLLIKGIEKAVQLGIDRGVMHLGLPDNLPSKGERKWMQTFSETFEDILSFSEKNKFTLYLENTWEKKLSPFTGLFGMFASDYLAMCLDIAHVYCFSGLSFDEWWDKFHHIVKHIHLSDNNLDEDSHLPLGTGSIDYSSVIKKLPVTLTYTLENDIGALRQSLSFLERNALLDSYNK